MAKDKQKKINKWFKFSITNPKDKQMKGEKSEKDKQSKDKQKQLKKDKQPLLHGPLKVLIESIGKSVFYVTTVFMFAIFIYFGALHAANPQYQSSLMTNVQGNLTAAGNATGYAFTKVVRVFYDVGYKNYKIIWVLYLFGIFVVYQMVQEIIEAVKEYNENRNIYKTKPPEI